MGSDLKTTSKTSDTRSGLSGGAQVRKGDGRQIRAGFSRPNSEKRT